MSGIVVIFPGIGYNINKPLLYYGRKLAAMAAYDTEVSMEYSYRPGDIFGNQEKISETIRIFTKEAEERLSGIKWEQYDRILFISKSIGTAVAVNYSTTCGIAGVKHILYTPLIQTFDNGIKNARAYIGTADPWSDFNLIRELAGKYNVPLRIYKNCNHSLESSDVIGNIDVLEDIMKDTDEFL